MLGDSLGLALGGGETLGFCWAGHSEDDLDFLTEFCLVTLKAPRKVQLMTGWVGQMALC